MKRLFLLFMLMFVSCATMKTPMQHEFSGPVQKNLNADPVKVFFLFSHYRQLVGYDAIPKLDNEHQRIRSFDDIFKDALSELSNIESYTTMTEYSSDVNKPSKRALKDSLEARHDFVVQMRFMRKRSFAKSFLGELVSASTATLFPIGYRQQFELQVSVYDHRHRLLKNYHRDADLVKYVQTILIFVYPFYPEMRIKEQIYVDFIHDIFKQMESEKLLTVALK